MKPLFERGDRVEWEQIDWNRTLTKVECYRRTGKVSKIKNLPLVDGTTVFLYELIPDDGGLPLRGIVERDLAPMGLLDLIVECLQ